MSGEELLPFEEDLSAYLDGELDAEREAELRAELDRNPALAARLEALRAVDAGLRASPSPAASSDLRARLQARLDAQGAPATRGQRAAPRRRRRSVAPAVVALAVAAALALVVWVGRPSGDLPPEHVAEQPLPAPEPVMELPRPAPTPGIPEAPLRADRIAEWQPVAPDAAPAVNLAAASDEELDIAMEWDVLEDVDLEMMEELELLEAMLAMERRGQG